MNTSLRLLDKKRSSLKQNNFRIRKNSKSVFLTNTEYFSKSKLGLPVFENDQASLASFMKDLKSRISQKDEDQYFDNENLQKKYNIKLKRQFETCSIKNNINKYYIQDQGQNFINCDGKIQLKIIQRVNEQIHKILRSTNKTFIELKIFLQNFLKNIENEEFKLSRDQYYKIRNLICTFKVILNTSETDDLSKTQNEALQNIIQIIVILDQLIKLLREFMRVTFYFLRCIKDIGNNFSSKFLNTQQFTLEIGATYFEFVPILGDNFVEKCKYFFEFSNFFSQIAKFQDFKFTNIRENETVKHYYSIQANIKMYSQRLAFYCNNMDNNFRILLKQFLLFLNRICDNIIIQISVRIR